MPTQWQQSTSESVATWKTRIQLKLYNLLEKMACKVEMICINLVKAYKNTVDLLYWCCNYLFIHAASSEMPQSNKSMPHQSSFKCPLCLLSGAISKHLAVVNPALTTQGPWGFLSDVQWKCSPVQTVWPSKTAGLYHLSLPALSRDRPPWIT